MARKNWIVNSIINGIAGATATAAVIGAYGKATHKSFWTPFNGTAHMVLGETAAEKDGFHLPETALGLAIHAVSLGGWGVLYELLAGDVRFPASLLTGATVTGTIYALDYHILPDRLRPGFEKRLGKDAVVVTYVMLGLVLSLSPFWTKPNDPRTGDTVSPLEGD